MKNKNLIWYVIIFILVVAVIVSIILAVKHSKKKEKDSDTFRPLRMERHPRGFRVFANDTPIIKYKLGSVQDLKQIYPYKDTLPAVYQSLPMYQDLTKVVEHFTRQSLDRDSISIDSLNVYQDGDDIWIQFTSSDPTALYYPIQHPAFVQVALLALPGIQKCKAQQNCWNNDAKEPYVFLLCWGLPLVNHKTVFLLHFPPTKALTDADYNSNFTIRTVERRMQNVGNSPSFAVIDVLPIAANFAASSFPDPYVFFKDYIIGMVNLMTNPPTNNSSKGLPLIVLGGEPRSTWSKIIQTPVDILSTGITSSIFSKPIPWISGNHPNVTTYNGCPNDACASVKDRDLVKMEMYDLIIAAWAKQLTLNPNQSPDEALSYCKNTWYPNNAALACVQAKLDNSYDSKAMCKTMEEAQAFCQKYNNDPCATDLACDGSSGGCSR